LPPSIDTSSEDHLTFFKASFDEGDAMHGGMTDAAWKGMLSAQATWDGAMAWNAVKAFERVAADPQSVVVVLVGSGHVAYGLGIERQARAYFHERIASIIAVPIADEHGPVPVVRASYANFIWGVAHEKDSAWPTLGLSTRTADDGRRIVIDVEKDSPASRAGLAVGDMIVAIDQTPIANRESLNRVLAGYQWGDVAHVTVHRGEAEITLGVPLRRQP
jgi:membrane-associated protease RseP (regulator of RpoE activity)